MSLELWLPHYLLPLPGMSWPGRRENAADGAEAGAETGHGLLC